MASSAYAGRKALYLLNKSNPPLLEWLNSHIIYKKTETVEKIRNLIAHYFNPRGTIFHYLHMAIGNYKGYIEYRKNKGPFLLNEGVSNGSEQFGINRNNEKMVRE